MKLHSKMIYDSQSLSTLDIPTELLTSTAATHQKKRMIAPGSSGSCCLEIIIGVGVSVGVLVLCGFAICIYRSCPEESQARNDVGDRNRFGGDKWGASVAAMTIADTEEPSTNENEQDTVIQISAECGETPSPRHHRRHHKEYTDIMISAESSAESGSSPVQVISST